MLPGALMKPVQAGTRGGWRLIGCVRWSPWPGGRRGRSSRARRSSATDPERVGALAMRVASWSAEPHRPRARRDARRAPSDSDSGALGGSFRPAPRHIGVATAESCGNRRAHPGCWPERSSQSAISRPGRAPREPSSPPRRAARTLWRLRPRRCCAPAPGAPGRRPPPPQSGASTGREDRAGKGGRRITFGCVGGAAHPGNGVIAPLRDGRGAGWRVKDTRRPPF